MNSLLEQLHDIEGLDPISMWPLASGWWILISCGTVIALSMGIAIFYYLAFRRSWRNDTLQKLAALEENLSEDTSRDSVILLSEYVRRIALRRYSRKECAGLVGNAWLQWLTKRDPKKFDWEKNGVLLIEIPYAPSHLNILSLSDVKQLITAVREWI
ncbi:MAG: DUF4381 domain-containing protein [Parachlamydiaceae bacterium]